MATRASPIGDIDTTTPSKKQTASAIANYGRAPDSLGTAPAISDDFESAITTSTA